jgi:two-component system sensor histidine kinase MtrB
MDSGRVDIEHMLVHNLKSPVTGLLATLEMLADGDFGPLSAGQQRAVSDMQGHGTQLLGLLDELLEIGRMESQGVAVRTAPVDVRCLLQDIRGEWSLRLGDRLQLGAAGDLPRVTADPVVLRSVIHNLLLNAVMHAGASVRVHLGAEVCGDRVQVTVSDDGPGIPAAHAERVFEKFVRLDDPGRVSRGSGLGLAFCRAAMEAMGGAIALDVDAPAGATFRLDLQAAHGAGGTR